MCVYYHARRRHEYLGKGGDNGGKVFPGQIASWPWRADLKFDSWSFSTADLPTVWLAGSGRAK